MTWKELKEQIEELTPAEQEEAARYVVLTDPPEVTRITIVRAPDDIQQGEGEERGTVIAANQLLLMKETISLAEMDVLFGIPSAG